ncbi:MAG: hypothetical protein M3R36_07115 [Bacteroidota bacterium]|nr:hypothetical protein [Bacteroidota bacterium]
MKSKFLLIVVLLMILISILGNNSFAQTAKDPAAEKLALMLSNPVANLISVPFQNNTVWGIGELNGSQNVLNFQPVIPVSISKGINLINRIVLPMVTQYNITGVAEKQNSLGDALYSIFISPAKSKVIWGVGPVMSIPTATNKNTGSGRFSIGPTGVILYQTSGWTMGSFSKSILVSRR